MRSNPDGFNEYGFGADGMPFFSRRNKVEQQPAQEEYGEIDRPLPLDDIDEIKDKFVEWDMYKMIVMKNLIQSQKKL